MVSTRRGVGTAGRKRKAPEPAVTFAILHVESGKWEGYSGYAAREILRSLIESEADKLPRWVEEKEDSGGITEIR